MKKAFLLIAIVAMCVLGIQNAQAQDVDYSGIYTGSLSNVTMNDNTYADVSGVTFTLTKLSGTNYKLTSTAIGPIGSMPGTINVNATVTITDDGTMSATAGKQAGTLVTTTLGATFKIYMTSISGDASESPLSFVLDTYALKILGYEAFNASVTFTAN